MSSGGVVLGGLAGCLAGGLVLLFRSPSVLHLTPCLHVVPPTCACRVPFMWFSGTPLGRMDEMAAAVLVINATGEIQMANKQSHILFGHKRGQLDSSLLARSF